MGIAGNLYMITMTFPVMTSTVSADALCKLVCKTYAFEEDTTCTLLRTGMNHSYLVCHGNTRYIFRVYCYQWRTREEITEELRLLLLLKERGIGVSYPVADRKGNFLQEIHAPEGMRLAVLFSYASGAKVRFMNDETYTAIGSCMGKMHTITEHLDIARVTYRTETLVTTAYERIRTFFSRYTCGDTVYKESRVAAFRKIAKESLEDWPRGVVHLDMWYDNMSVGKDNTITLFDFDFCGNGPLLLDIAYCCKQLFHIEADKRAYKQKEQLILDGYRSVRPLSEEELKYIPEAAVLIWIFYLGVQVQRFDWSNIFLSENYLKMYVGRIKSWIDYYNVPLT